MCHDHDSQQFLSRMFLIRALGYLVNRNKDIAQQIWGSKWKIWGSECIIYLFCYIEIQKDITIC